MESSPLFPKRLLSAGDVMFLSPLDFFIPQILLLVSFLLAMTV